MKTAVLLLSVLPSVLGTGFGLLRVGGGSAAERAVRSQEFGLSRRDKAAQS